jgi:ElaB/YqjD/DUF883 family membrane-anchored ribosome-binding protein
MQTSTATAQRNGRLKENVSRIRKSASDAEGNILSDLDTAAHAMGEHVRDFVETAVASASESMAGAKETIVDATDTVAKTISEKPLTAVVIAAGVGALIGFLLRRS